MRSRRTRTALAAAAVVAAGLAGTTTGSAGAQPDRASAPARTERTSGPATSYVVLATSASELAAARQAATAAGGTVVAENAAIGTLTVSAPADGYLAALQGKVGVAGAAKDRSIAAKPGLAPKRDLVERPAHRSPERPGPGGPERRTSRPPGTDRFESLQWDMKMIHADVARRVDPGSPHVLVGIMDTGIDASNPDLAPNFDAARSRNFTTDLVQVDGPCEVASCVDPNNVDDGAHGTHVAGSVAGAANGTGIVGVAPGVKLVNIRAGQDSGYFFLAPTLDALTYSGDIGIDVVNMSFYVDPWLYNCRSNPADSPLAQYEQRSIVSAVNRALDYAHERGVTLVAAAGNENTDLGKPGLDASSPDFPLGAAYPRQIDNDDCLSMPGEGDHVLSTSSVGPDKDKAGYSNYGLERVWVAAPGGDSSGGPAAESLILSSYPKHVLQQEGAVDPDGNVVRGYEDRVLKDCTAAGACGYYTYLQGTSMAAPHAAGVAALAVSEHGQKDKEHGGLTLDPNLTAVYLAASATPNACPAPPQQGDPAPPNPKEAGQGAGAVFQPGCEGGPRFNGFYGFGIVDAARMVGAHVDH